MNPRPNTYHIHDILLHPQYANFDRDRIDPLLLSPGIRKVFSAVAPEFSLDQCEAFLFVVDQETATEALIIGVHNRPNSDSASPCGYETMLLQCGRVGGRWESLYLTWKGHGIAMPRELSREQILACVAADQARRQPSFWEGWPGTAVRQSRLATVAGTAHPLPIDGSSGLHLITREEELAVA